MSYEKNPDQGAGHVRCPKCGAISVKKHNGEFLFCWYTVTCGWEKLNPDYNATNTNEPSQTSLDIINLVLEFLDQSTENYDNLTSKENLLAIDVLISKEN